MSKRKNADTALFILSLVCYLLMSTSFLLMPFCVTEQGSVAPLTYVAGGMFWLFLILGIALQVILSVRRKNWYIRNRIKRSRRSARQKNGFVSFFKNTYGTVADILMLLSVAGFIISIIISEEASYICYVFLSIGIFAFCMHCIFNGKIFYHIEHQDGILEAAEKERKEHNKESV